MLGIDVEHAVLLVSLLSDGFDSFRKLFIYLQIVFSEANTAADGNTIHEVLDFLGVTVKTEKVRIGIDFKSADFVRGVMVKLERLLEGLELFLGEADASLEKGASQVAGVNWFLLVELQDVVHVSLLGPTHLSHDVSRDQSGELEGKVAFVLISGGDVNELQDIFIDLSNLLVVHLRHAFNDTHSYAADVLSLEVGFVLHQGLKSLTGGEQAAHRLVHGEVGESDAQELVA